MTTKWIEKFFKLIPLPYAYTSVGIGLIIYIIYYLLIKSIPDLSFEDYNIVFLATSAAIGLQLGCINYFMIKFKNIFCKQMTRIKMDKKCDICNYVIDNFGNKKSYLIIIFVIIPFIFLFIYYLELGYPMFFYQTNPSAISLLFDLYANFLGFFMLFLLAISIWIIINMSNALKKLGSEECNLQLDLLNPDTVGGLSPIRNFVFHFIIYYSILTILALLTYSTPVALLYYESFILIFLYIIVLSQFVESWYAIRRILKLEKGRQIEQIMEPCRRETKRLFDLILEENAKNRDEISLISRELDILFRERDRLLNTRIQIYGLGSLASLMVSTLATIVTFLNNLETLRDLSIYPSIILDFNNFRGLI